MAKVFCALSTIEPGSNWMKESYAPSADEGPIQHWLLTTNWLTGMYVALSFMTHDVIG